MFCQCSDSKYIAETIYITDTCNGEIDTLAEIVIEVDTVGWWVELEFEKKCWESVYSKRFFCRKPIGIGKIKPDILVDTTIRWIQ